MLPQRNLASFSISAILAPVASPGGASHGVRSQHRPQTHRQKPLICCDATGKEISENISNVLKLCRCLREPDRTPARQMVSFDPGIGAVTAFVNGAPCALTLH
ncbi:phospholipase effector Tle1 domain-containing protein [Bradyrhizobium sp. WSM1743]|uniref:phospholipase effector Tle1 domain-containing protein n=1 Tax=Bradyrhizobium sp. WSM1743 TaxID=318996 RepID=UPI000A01FA40